VDFLLVKVSNNTLSECPACSGLWVENDTHQQICTDLEQQQAAMGFNSKLVRAAGAANLESHGAIRSPDGAIARKKVLTSTQLAGLLPICDA
jgi:Zn-finger nucleic acid-binding protein